MKDFISLIQFLVVLGLVAITSYAWYLSGEKDKEFEIYKEAVQFGVGEYYLDTNFNKQFRWKTNSIK